jgi:hypothetical protein
MLTESLFSQKDYRRHIQYLRSYLLEGHSFAFNRISDGELYILNGLSIELQTDGALINGLQVNRQRFFPWDRKSFDPVRDTFIANGVRTALRSSNPAYLLGLPCPCCCDPIAVCAIRSQASATQTWANLLVNSNYRFFLEEIFPILQGLPLMVAVNHAASMDVFRSCPHHTHFCIPDNVLQSASGVLNDFLDCCSGLKDGTVVLVGASSAAKIFIHQGFHFFPRLTFIDIGTTLNPLLRLGLGRDYLRTYWSRSTHPNLYASRACIW